MAVNCADIINSRDFCLEGRGNAVIKAEKVKLLCQFSDYLSGVVPTFSCDLSALGTQIACLAATGTSALGALEVNILCALLVSLAGAVTLSGNGNPNGVVTGYKQGQLYVDLLTAQLYKFLGTVGTKTGWQA